MTNLTLNDRPSTDLYDQLRSLIGDPMLKLSVVEDHEAPELWSVWTDGDEILGAGDTRDEALAEAIATVRGWEALGAA